MCPPLLMLTSAALLCWAALPYGMMLLSVLSHQAPVPAGCGQGSYRAADGCQSCSAASSPFTKFNGGV